MIVRRKKSNQDTLYLYILSQETPVGKIKIWRTIEGEIASVRFYPSKMEELYFTNYELGGIKSLMDKLYRGESYDFEEISD